MTEGPVGPSIPSEPAALEPDKRGGQRVGFWGRRVLPLALVLLLGIGVGVFVLADDSPPREVLVEAANSVGLDPFTTTGIAPTVLTSPAPSPGPGLFGGTRDNGVCAPGALVAFLAANPAKAAAWAAALDADPTLQWSGGDSLTASDIKAYVGGLTPAILAADTRVTNNGYKDGKATPRQSLLKKGTAVLVDDKGIPRVRCFCGNPLRPPDGGGGTSASLEPTASPTASPEPTATPSATPSPDGCIPDAPETDGCGPEPTDPPCPPVADLPSGVTDVTTAPVDFNGDGTPDVLRVYKIGATWHARAEVAGIGIGDLVLTGSGPTMTAIGGATVDALQPEEAWVKVGSGSSTDIIGLLVYRDCMLQRVELNGSPAEFPVGATVTAADGVSCFGFDTGIEVFTTTSTDGVTYTGSSSLYTIDQGSSPPSLVLGSTAAQAQTTSDGASWNALHTFNCDSLSVIP